MKTAQRNVQSVVLSVAAFFFLVVGNWKAFHFSPDFVPIYTGARCLLHGCNPYNVGHLERQFFQAGGAARQLPSWRSQPPVYPPSTFLALSPLALTSFHAARICWALLNSCLFVAAVILMLAEAPKIFLWLSTVLGAMFLLSYWGLVALGQASLFSIAFAVISTALFLGNRYLGLATVMLMLSLAVKPQIGGLIVLYLLLRRIHWRHAIAAAAGALVMLFVACGILQLHPASANWRSDLAANIAASVAPGGTNDPTPADTKEIGWFSNLQPITSVYSSNPHIFNGVAYTIFLCYLAIWMIVVQKTGTDSRAHYLNIAVLAVLSLLPIYHRSFDTALLLITIPAVSLIFQTSRVVGALIIGVTILLQVEHPAALIWVRSHLQHYSQWQSIIQNRFLYIIVMQQPAFLVLLLASLYLAAMFVMAKSMHLEAALRAQDRGQNGNRSIQ